MQDRGTACQGCQKPCELVLIAMLEKEVTEEGTTWVHGKMGFCYNCLNTNLVDALGHGIRTEHDTVTLAEIAARKG